MNRRMCVAHVVALVVIGVCVVAMPTFAQGEEKMAPIDPAVLAQFNANGKATFFVLFRERADLSPASKIRDWGERGWFVYEHLVATAESSQARVRALLGALGAEMRPFWIANAIEVRTDNRALLSVLTAQPEVAEIVTPPTVKLIQAESGVELHRTDSIGWNVERIRAPMVWSTYGVRGEGVVIGSIDTGVQYDHPALVNQYRGNLGGDVFDHNYNWYDPAHMCGNPSTAPCDPGWHGTATTGVTVGDDGGANQIGVAPGAKFIVAAVDWTNSSLLSAMEWMLAPRDLGGQNYRPDLRPHVVNNSWGAAGGGTLYQAAVQAWLDSGIFPVFAFGNDGPGCGTGLVPASYLEAYAVGAFDFYDTITNFSSRGPSVFHPIKPDVAAPGDFIRSCVPPDSYATGLWGTSYSAPHVTGTVALMWSRSPELTGKVERTWLYLDRSAIDVEDLSCGGEPGNNNVWGEGRLDAFAAVSFVFIDGFESGDTSAWSISLP